MLNNNNWCVLVFKVNKDTVDIIITYCFNFYFEYVFYFIQIINIIFFQNYSKSNDNFNYNLYQFIFY